DDEVVRAAFLQVLREQAVLHAQPPGSRERDVRRLRLDAVPHYPSLGGRLQEPAPGGAYLQQALASERAEPLEAVQDHLVVLPPQILEALDARASAGLEV